MHSAKKIYATLQKNSITCKFLVWMGNLLNNPLTWSVFKLTMHCEL